MTPSALTAPGAPQVFEGGASPARGARARHPLQRRFTVSLALWLVLSLGTRQLLVPIAYADDSVPTANTAEPAPPPAPAPAPGGATASPGTAPRDPGRGAETARDTAGESTGSAGGSSGSSGSGGSDQSSGSGGILAWIAPSLGEPSWMASAFAYTIGTWLRDLNADFGNELKRFCCDSLNFVTRTPPDLSYASPTVTGLWRVSRAIANAALALVVLWGGFNVVARTHLGSPYHAAMELFPRLALGALLANTSLLWGQLAIDANNGLSQALGQATLPAWDGAASWDRAVIGLLVGLVYLVMGLVLLLQQLARLALVDVLLVLAPLGLLCWVLPQTQSWAHLWSQTFVAAVFTQFVQAVTLKVGSSLIADFSPATADATIISLFLGIAVLALTLKIPSLMRGGSGGGPGIAGYLLLGRAGRALRGGNGRPGAGAAAGGSAVAAGAGAQMSGRAAGAAGGMSQSVDLRTRWRPVGSPAVGTAGAPYGTSAPLNGFSSAGAGVASRAAPSIGAGRGAS